MLASGSGSLGLIGKNVTSTCGSARNCASSNCAWMDWPPMISIDGATSNTRIGTPQF
jgi:hypothetical protein